MNGGRCALEGVDQETCLCPLGTMGASCQHSLSISALRFAILVLLNQLYSIIENFGSH